MTNPVDGAFPTTGNGARSDVVDYLKARLAHAVQSVAELQGDDFTGYNHIRVRTTGALYEYDSTETGADDGVNILADTAGNRFVRVGVKMAVVTQAEYDALTPDSTTLYIVVP